MRYMYSGALEMLPPPIKNDSCGIGILPVLTMGQDLRCIKLYRSDLTVVKLARPTTSKPLAKGEKHPQTEI